MSIKSIEKAHRPRFIKRKDEQVAAELNSNIRRPGPLPYKWAVIITVLSVHSVFIKHNQTFLDIQWFRSTWFLKSLNTQTATQSKHGWYTKSNGPGSGLKSAGEPKLFYLSDRLARKTHQNTVPHPCTSMQHRHLIVMTVAGLLWEEKDAKATNLCIAILYLSTRLQYFDGMVFQKHGMRES